MPASKRKSKHRSVKSPRIADTADRHVYYQRSVQNVDFELDFVADTFRTLRRRKLKDIREDFCGTAASATEWVKRKRSHTAIGVDLDDSVLDWGIRNNVNTLTPAQQRRLQLIRDDVLQVDTAPVDAIMAFNFSYWIFKQRATLLAYFEAARRHLRDDGLLFLDAFGGPEAYTVQTEPRKENGFTYVWDQAEFNALTQEMKCRIHFKFKDRSELRNAFEYEWRLWGPQEICDVLADAGFSRTRFYLQGYDDDKDEPLDEFVETQTAEGFDCWIAYLVAEK